MAQAQPKIDDDVTPEPNAQLAPVVGTIAPAERSLDKPDARLVSISSEKTTSQPAAPPSIPASTKPSITPSAQPSVQPAFSDVHQLTPFPEQQTEQQKLQWTYSYILNVTTLEEFFEFFAQLKQLDENSFSLFGGEILDAVRDDKNPFFIDAFDDRYLTLIQLMAHASLPLATAFHNRAEQLCYSHANSLIRYTRLRTALKNSHTALINQKASGALLKRINPVMDRGIREELIEISALKSQLKTIATDEAVQWHFPHEKSYRRSFQRVSVSDEMGVANRLWIDPTSDKTSELFTVLSVPNVRVSRAPTGISWQDGSGNYYYRYRNSDMYHYFRMSGTAAFSPVKRHLQFAFFIPRIGNQNHYHTLVDKLPALMAYKQFGLDCPIVSTFELDDTEKYFCRGLGIDPDTIIVDSLGELIAERGIIADAETMRAPFYEYCQSLELPNMRFGKKIYISRASSKDRPMANEAEVEALMLSKGFGIVAMERYSLEEQIANYRIPSRSGIIQYGLCQCRHRHRGTDSR